jgi:hypothetical protein
MESVLVCFVSIALMIVSVVTMTMNTLQSTAQLSDTWKAMQERAASIQRTEIVSLPPDNYYGGIIELTVKNAGQINISDFAHWDVIVEEQGASAGYIDFSSDYPPASNQWAVQAIYISNNQPEVFDLNILNPGEEMVVGINPGEGIEVGESLKITLATSDGVTSQCYVTRQEAPPAP